MIAVKAIRISRLSKWSLDSFWWGRIRSQTLCTGSIHVGSRLNEVQLERARRRNRAPWLHGWESAARQNLPFLTTRKASDEAYDGTNECADRSAHEEPDRQQARDREEYNLHDVQLVGRFTLKV